MHLEAQLKMLASTLKFQQMIHGTQELSKQIFHGISCMQRNHSADPRTQIIIQYLKIRALLKLKDTD